MLVTFILATRFLPGTALDCSLYSCGTCTPSGMSMRPGEPPYDEPCDETDNAGEGDRTDETEDWREWDLPLEGGRSVPSFAVIELRKSALDVSTHLAKHALLTSIRLRPRPTRRTACQDPRSWLRDDAQATRRVSCRDRAFRKAMAA